MAEWSIAAVLKTVELRGSGGSNPSLSANKTKSQFITKQTPDFTPKNVKSGVIVFMLTSFGQIRRFRGQRILLNIVFKHCLEHLRVYFDIFSANIQKFSIS